jgi:hypothetical protein
MADEEVTEGGSESTVPLTHAKELGEALAHIEVLRAAHKTLALGVTASNALINDLGTRMDSLVQAQAQFAEDIAKLKPVAAAEAEGEGVEGAIAGTDPPPGTEQVAEKESNSPLAGFHKLFG